MIIRTILAERQVFFCKWIFNQGRHTNILPGGNVFTGVCLSTGGGLCQRGGLYLRGGLCPCQGAPPVRYRADGTHPTGMHSCFKCCP